MRFTELEKAEVWDRWQGGEAMRTRTHLDIRDSICAAPMACLGTPTTISPYKP